MSMNVDPGQHTVLLRQSVARWWSYANLVVSRTSSAEHVLKQFSSLAYQGGGQQQQQGQSRGGKKKQRLQHHCGGQDGWPEAGAEQTAPSLQQQSSGSVSTLWWRRGWPAGLLLSHAGLYRQLAAQASRQHCLERSHSGAALEDGPG
jgi:hypothetical protein